MAFPPEKPSPRPRLGWLVLVVLALLALLPLRWPPDGVSRATWGQFLGRFHPSLVHFPVALILLAALLEVCASFRRWAGLRTAVTFVLGCAAIGAVAAAIDGWLLARSGGYSGHLVVTHMWSGVALAALCSILAWLRPAAVGAAVLPYRLLLAATVALTAWTSHQGGSLTHGGAYLTEYMPGRLRSLLGVEAPRPKRQSAPPAVAQANATLYRQRIAPLLQKHCVSCHGPKKIKGGLRVDSYARLLAGGEDGPVVAPWYPQRSELIRRVTLPQDDDDFMPSGGKKALTSEEVAVLENWIAAGATETEPADAGTPEPQKSGP